MSIERSKKLAKQEPKSVREASQIRTRQEIVKNAAKAKKAEK